MQECKLFQFQRLLEPVGTGHTSVTKLIKSSAKLSDHLEQKRHSVFATSKELHNILHGALPLYMTMWEVNP